MYSIYFIQSLRNNKVYVGRTHKKPEVRLYEHNNNTNIWSSNNKPFKLIYYEKYSCLQDAISREKFYKTGFGKNIKKLIVSFINENKIKAEINHQ